MEQWSGPLAPQEPSPAPGLVTGAAYGVLVVLGLFLGAITSFQFSWTAGSVPVAAILLSFVEFAAFRLAGWAMESKLGVVALAVPWLIVVVLLSSRRPEGDLVVTGTTAGYVFIFGGAIAAVVAVATTRSARPWILRGTTSVPASRD
ncbi:DUF6113 family protein [Actinoallomurus soli]|uniref:DUF6113 family protein n=1 Tax=Actinoallomurus soli TaxID=2952535 RepID=UPI002092DE80|nr:DUF6113 family protein [Actinoallomurus soli]MCO5972073.1 DUF6113 family protein [Actinoallomurus soli]